MQKYFEPIVLDITNATQLPSLPVLNTRLSFPFGGSQSIILLPLIGSQVYFFFKDLSKFDSSKFMMKVPL